MRNEIFSIKTYAVGWKQLLDLIECFLKILHGGCFRTQRRICGSGRSRVACISSDGLSTQEVCLCEWEEASAWVEQR